MSQLECVKMPHEALSEVPPGDKLGFNVRNMFIKDVYLCSTAGYGKTSPEWEHLATLQAIIPNHPGQISACCTPAPGHPVAHSKFSELKVNSHSGKMLEGGSKFWESEDTVIVSMAHTYGEHL